MIKTLDKQKRMVQKQKECRKPSMHTKDVSTAVVVVIFKPINASVDSCLDLQSTGQGGQAGYDQEVMSSEKDML